MSVLLFHNNLCDNLVNVFTSYRKKWIHAFSEGINLKRVRGGARSVTVIVAGNG